MSELGTMEREQAVALKSIKAIARAMRAGLKPSMLIACAGWFTTALYTIPAWCIEPAAAGRGDAVAKQVAAERELEAVVLQSMLEQIMPATKGGMFGASSAERQWRSLYTGQLAKQIAAGGHLRLRPGAPAPVIRRPSAVAVTVTHRAAVPACRGSDCPSLGTWRTTISAGDDDKSGAFLRK